MRRKIPGYLIFPATIVYFTLCGVLSSFSQTTTTIGTGTATQKQPFGIYYGYERSAAIYTGTFNYIQTLGWYVGTGYPVTCPVKIYLKPTTATTVTVTTWEVMKSGSTLVFDATVSFPSSGWQTIDIADFASTSSGLLVLCETNYGGIGSSSYPVFRYSTATNTHEYWQGDEPPTGNGTRNNNRPNIQITHIPMGSPVPPSGFMAVASGSGQIDLSWKKNLQNDNVMIAYNTEDVFGTPSGSYVSGNAIPGGGTVIYNGSLLTYSHSAGLNPSTTYYYKAWSVHAPTPTYSNGTGSSAMTWCSVLSSFPYSVDFEPVQFPPGCWSTAGNPPSRSAQASGYGIGSASAVFDFLNVVSGNFDLVSPEFSITSLTNPVVSFDHAYATYTAEVDELQLYYSTNGGSSYTMLANWLGGTSGPLNTGGAVVGSFIPTSLQWASKSVALPAGTNRLIFRGVSMHGNYLYLDNIVIAGSCSPANTPTAVITPSGPTTFCQGGSVTLAASGGTNYQWSTGSSSSSLVASTSGMYTVTVTNSSGCTDSESATVTVNPGVTVDVQIAADINPAEEGELVTFAAASQNGGTTPVYQWRVNGTTAGSNAASFSYVPVDDDSVYCILLSNADCAIDNPDTSNVVIMEVIPLPVLSLISPNGGESWTQGSQQVIAWNDNFSEPVKIELYKAGEYVMTLAAATPSTGSFGWTVPLDQKAGGDYTIRITNTGNSAVSDESDQYFSIAAIIPENQLIQDLTVANGADTCIAASQTITVAGGGSSVTVQTAGSLTCIAGQRILIFPGTYIYEGAFFSAFISLTGEYCDSPYAPLTKESIWSDNINSKKEAHFKVYPNPCFDWIHVVANGVQTEEKAILTIHRSDGRLVRKTDFEPGRTFNFCHELKPGIYTVGLSYAGTADYQLLVVIE